MRKAYDTILQFEVSADLAAQSEGFEAYRYECAYCGEEVYVAAPFSTRMVAHFRHRSGNNDVECENYLGQYGAISMDSGSSISNRERVEFYYDNSSKTFNLGLRFSENEIQGYEQQNVDFEVRTQNSDTPFRVLSINSINFTPDAPTMIPLNIFSFCYRLSNTLNGVQRKYDLLKRGNIPTFFKLQGNDNDFKARLVRSAVLFTNTHYFVTLHSQYSTPREVLFPSEIDVGQTFFFKTMGRNFLGIVMSITRKTASLESLLNSWGYQLEASEELTLLWPPASIINDVSVVQSDNAYVFSSFDLRAHGNINVHSEDIVKVSQGISRLSIKPKTRIFMRNAEMVIDKIEPPIAAYCLITLSISTAKNFIVPNDGVYFLFNRSGVSPLKHGQIIFLTPESFIVRYECNYPIGYIYPCSQNEWTGEEMLEDILAHYKRKEVFDPTLFSSLALSETASQYIEDCRTLGLINSVAKQLIEEGQL